MKIHNMTAFLLAAVALCSCGREELPEMSGDTEVTLHVGLASTQSKTWLDSQSEGSHKKVYWSDGDIINVNGRPSTPISIRGGQTISEADFFLRGVEAPYSVIYPHAAVVSGSASEGSGKSLIELPSEQQYNPATFANGAAVMYGYSEGDDEQVTLKNLCAAVKVNIKGKAQIKSAKLIAESSDAALCGLFMIDPKDGSMIVKEGKSELSLLIEDELVLSPEGTDFYFTIPEGNYSEGLSFFFTQAADGRTMQCIWKPESPLKAGVLYSFNDIAYAPGAKDIETEAEWEEFALAVNEGGDVSKYLYKDGVVRLAADLEDSEENPLTSIAVDFTYTFEGNGNTITRTNATAALFSSVSGTVKNLTVAGKLTLAEGGAPLVDILVDGGKITGCTNAMEVSFDAAAHGNVAGIVRLVNGGTVEGCTNSGAINAKVDVSAANYNAVVGGIASQIHASDYAVTINNCKNTAAITLAPVSGSSNGTGMPVCGLGGIAGWIRSGSAITLDNCDNSGAITLSAENVVSDRGFIAYSMHVGGVAGLATPINTSGDNQGLINTPNETNGLNVTFKDCDNTAIVHNCGINYSTTQQTNTKVFTGGLVGSLLGRADNFAEVDNCSNTGVVYTYDLTGDSSSSRPGYSAVAGGLVGFGGYLDIKNTTVNCEVGNGKRPMVAMAGVIGFAERPFKLTDSNIYVSGYFQRFEGYKMNRAVVAVVPVKYDTKAMGMVPNIEGSTITNCKIGGYVLSHSTSLTSDDKSDLSASLKVKLFNSESKTSDNLVCGQGFTANTGVTITGYTYWDGK